jgi:predicted nuclease with RNAse H fold
LKRSATLIPTAARSYQQAIKDLTDADRLSFRGTASELREALREVLDHLAPDDAVMKVRGFQLDPKRSAPTMKQKVRFILRARKEGSRATETAETAAEAVDGIIASLARSTYDTGSVATHISGERRSVVQLKRYVEAVLSHLLEL